MDKMNKKKLLFMSISILGMLLVLVGTSYAFFTYSREGQKSNQLVTGTFWVVFQEESGAISLKNAYPMKDEEGITLDSFNFSVENKGDITAKYQISILEDESNTLNRSSLRYELKKQGEEGAISNLNDLVIKDNVTLDEGQKDTYELRIWLDEATGNEAMGKTWKGKVQVIAEESKAYAFEDYIAPTIKLNGERVMNVTKGEEFNDPGVESVSDNVDSLTKEQVTKRYEYFDGIKNQEATEVDTTKEGVYVIYYELLDSRGNKGVAARTVNVVQVNSKVPVVTLEGDEEVNLYVGESYTDEGASARDELGESLPVLVFGSYNTKSFGDYIIKYFAIDKDGNIGSNTRTIHVKVYEDPVGANRPELTDGLIPVYYDEDNQVWRKANKYGKWFSYGEQWWGNAVTLDQSIVRDVSGKNNNAIYDQGPISDGNTITTDGINDFIDLGLENVDFGQTFSTIVRFKVESFPTSGGGYIIGNAEAAGIYIVVLPSKNIFYGIYNGTDYVQKASTSTIEANKWYEMTMVFDGSSIKVYLDGVLFDSTTYEKSITMKVSPVSFYLGANPGPANGPSDQFSNITYSKAQIYKQVLTAQEVKDLYAGKELSDKSNLLAELNLKDPKLIHKVRSGNTITTNGMGDYIDLGLENVDFGNTFSTVIRFKVENFPNSGVGYIIGNAEGAGMSIFFLSSKKIQFAVHDGTNYNTKAFNKIFDTNKWYEIAMVFDGSSIKLYLDGVLFDSQTLANPSNMKVSTMPFNLGANPNSNGHDSYANITYSKAQIYKQVLTEQEIKDIYNGKELSDKNNLLVDLDFSVGDSIKNNTPLPMDAINTIWAWIPRYEYDYVNIANYAGGTKEQPGAIGIQFLNKISSSTGGNYMLHPAFTFGDKELKGLWFAKFAASSDKSCSPANNSVDTGCDSEYLNLEVKPNKVGWNGIRISTAFEVTRKMQTTNYRYYGFSNNNYYDIHLTKNSEWGAAAYLSQSKYGKQGNDDYQGANKEIYMNNSENFTTGMSNASPYSSTMTEQFTYDIPDKGYGASTTGNIYGIYDMAGGAYEYVMGVQVDSDGNPRSGSSLSQNSGFTGLLNDDTMYNGREIPAKKYYDSYTSKDLSSTACSLHETECNGGICYGHALSETANWYNDYCDTPDKLAPWFVRGGLHSNNRQQIYFVGRWNGSAGINYWFRPVIAI